MANVKISQLTPKGANLAATDLLEISEFNGSGYETKSITGQEIIDAASGGGAEWGTIAGDLFNQTDLQAQLDSKQDYLFSGTNIKTINGSSVLGSGDLVVSGGGGGGLSVPIPQVPTIGYMNGLINTNSTVPTQLNSMYLFPFIPMNDINTSYLTIQVTTAQAASTGKMVIYSSNIQGLPSSLLVESTALDCSTTGFKTFMVSATFTANTKYWIGFVGSVANISVTSNSLAPVIGVRTNSNGTFNCLLFTITYPTIPATLFAGSANFNNQTGCPRITFVF